MKVTSDSVVNGRLKTICAAAHAPNRPAGKNKSPRLEWSKVPGAKYYIAIMTDPSAHYWLHMFTSGIWTESLPEGQVPVNEYVGPYPPAGTGSHEYVTEVFAVKEDPSDITVRLDSPCDYRKLTAEIKAHDVIDSGSITGLFAHGDDTM